MPVGLDHFIIWKNEPFRISQIYFQNDTFAKCAILRTKQLSYIIIYCDDSFLRVKAFMHAWSRATEVAKIEEYLVTP